MDSMSRRTARTAQLNVQYQCNHAQLAPAERERPVRPGKRKADADAGTEVQFEPRKTPKPTDGVFIPRKPPPPPKKTLAATISSGMELEISPEQKAREEEARKLLMKQFLDSLDDDRAPTTGSARFIPTGPPRYAPWRAWRKDLASNPALAVEYQNRENQDLPWAWAQVYLTPQPSQADADRLSAAIAHIATLERGKGINPNNFEVRTVRKQGGKNAPSLFILAKSHEQCQLLTSLATFEYRDDDGSAIFFVHGAKKPATAIILDVKNAPDDAKSLMKGCLRALYDGIKWEKITETQLVPAHFAYTRVEGLRSQGGEKGTTWRVAFAPKTANYATWKYPPTAGEHGDKGEVTFDRPPFCDRCISFSHQPQACNWWTHNNTKSEAKRPADYVPLKWTAHKAFERADLPRGAVLAATEGQPSEPGPSKRAGSQVPQAVQVT